MRRSDDKSFREFAPRRSPPLFRGTEGAGFVGWSPEHREPIHSNDEGNP